MKFGAKLEVAIESEWKEHYMRYDTLKKALKRVDDALVAALSAGAAVVVGAESAEAVSAMLAFAEFEEAFFSALDADRERVEAFYHSQVNSFEEALIVLGRQLDGLAAAPVGKGKKDSAGAGGLSEAGRAGLRDASIDTYRRLQRLRNYCILNFTGFAKILKKYRKRVYTPRCEAADSARRAALTRRMSASPWRRASETMLGSPRRTAEYDSADGEPTALALAAPLLKQPSAGMAGRRQSVPAEASMGLGAARAARTAAVAQEEGGAEYPTPPRGAAHPITRPRAASGSTSDDAAGAPPPIPDPSRSHERAVSLSSFVAMAEVEALIEELELRFARAFCDGEIRLARAALLVRKSGRAVNWFHFARGFKLGLMAQLGVWVLWCVVVEVPAAARAGGAAAAALSAWMTCVMPVYRGAGLLSLALWVCAGCLAALERSRINYAYLFDQPRLSASSARMYDGAVTFTIVSLGSLLLSLKAMGGTLPALARGGVFPLLTFLTVPTLLLWPLARARLLSRTLLAQLLAAPCMHTTFFAAFVADWLTSLAKPLVDLAYAGCYALSGEFLLPLGAQGACARSQLLDRLVYPVLLVLPSAIRLGQCLRQYYDSGQRHPALWNALKYLMTLSVTGLGVFHKEFSHRAAHASISRYQFAWLTVYFTSALYSFAWDVAMDWGLGDCALARAHAAAIRSELLRSRRASALSRAPSDGSAGTASPAPGGSPRARAHEAEGDEVERGGAIGGGRKRDSLSSTASITDLEEVRERVKRRSLLLGHTSSAAFAAAESAPPCGLREQLLFRVPALYYLAISADLFGRFVFLYTLIPAGAHFEVDPWFIALGPFVASIELLRRGMWSLLRLENQQLGHGPERTSTSVDAIPLHFDQADGGRAASAAPPPQQSPLSMALEVGSFAAVAAGVLAFAYFTGQRQQQ